jgi:hypothetical protein
MYTLEEMRFRFAAGDISQQQQSGAENSRDWIIPFCFFRVRAVLWPFPVFGTV